MYFTAVNAVRKWVRKLPTEARNAAVEGDIVDFGFSKKEGQLASFTLRTQAWMLSVNRQLHSLPAREAFLSYRSATEL